MVSGNQDLIGQWLHTPRPSTRAAQAADRLIVSIFAHTFSDEDLEWARFQLEDDIANDPRVRDLFAARGCEE